MKLDELVERVKEEASIYSERIQNSTLYVRLKEQYDELSPNIQRLLQATALVLFLYIIFSFPLGWMNEANQNLAKYEKNRQLIEDLLRIQNETKLQPNVNIDINPNSLLSKAQASIRQIGIAEAQVKEARVLQNNEMKLSFMPKSMTYKGISVELSQLNLNQVIDIGTKMQNLTSSTKLIDIEINQNAKDDHYYDVKYYIAGFTGAGS